MSETFQRTRPLWFMLGTLLFIAPVLGQQKVDLRLRFTKDEIHSMTVTLDQKVEQTPERGKPEPLTQKLTLGYTIKVEDVDDRGQATLALKYDSVALHVASGSMTVDYDSTQPGSPEVAAASALGGLIGQGFTFTATPEGQITRITGLEKLATTIVNKLSGVEGPARVAAERFIRNQLGEAGVKASLQNMFAPFPDHPVAAGESWTRSVQLTTGFNLTLDMTCTLRGVENGVAVLEVTGHFATPGPVAMELNQTRFSYDFQGESRGQIRVRESTGWTEASSITQSLAGAATTGSPNVAPQSIPLKVESVLSVSGK